MNPPSRLDIFADSHFGLGIRWRVNMFFLLEVSIAIPFCTIIVGIGPRVP